MPADPILNVRARKRLYDFVCANPGYHLREVARATGLGLTLVDYHLRFLEKHGLVASMRDGEYKRYYPRSVPGADVGRALTSEERRLLALLRQPVPLRVISLLMEREAAAHKDLLERVPVGASTLSHHLGKLVAGGVIVRTKTGSYRVRDPHAVARLMVGYDLATPDQVDKFLEMWGEFRL
jgi:predicted transcriptional regulator